MGILKSIEEKQKQKALKLKQEADAELNRIQQIENERQKKIDAIEKEHQANMNEYYARCQQFAVNLGGFQRLLHLLSGYRIAEMPINERQRLIKNCKLEPLEKFVDELCEPVELPPTKPSINFEE